MKILNLFKDDWAGVGIRLTKAVNQYTEHEARHLCSNKHIFSYDVDIVSKDSRTIKNWIQWADVVNCADSPDLLNFAGVPKPQNLIMTYLGSYYRTDPRKRHEEAVRRGVKKELTGLTLTRWGATLIPGIVPVDDWVQMKRTHIGKPIICQTPSKRSTKNTDEIERLLVGRTDSELLIVEGVSWHESMKCKSIADLYIGEFTGYGYGVSVLEAWAMKIPVICYVSPEIEKEIFRQTGMIPYYNTPLAQLVEAVDLFLSDREAYEDYVSRGYEFVKKVHDAPVVARNFVNICEEICQPEFKAELAWREPE